MHNVGTNVFMFINISTSLGVIYSEAKRRCCNSDAELQDAIRKNEVRKCKNDEGIEFYLFPELNFAQVQGTENKQSVERGNKNWPRYL